MSARYLAGLLALLAVSCAGPRPYDLVVYGGTSAGVAAAVQARRMGKSVALIEPTQHLGGLSSGGLGATDIGNKGAIGGISREFYTRLGDHYRDERVWVHEDRAEYLAGSRRRGDGALMWTFEPHVAEQVFGDLVREHGVDVFFGERLDRATGVAMQGTRITALGLESGRVLRGRMYIDASYEGDLLAAAGVTYRVGREGQDEYGEDLNGVRAERAVHHQFVRSVDPYLVPGDPSSGLLPEIQGQDPGVEGAADHRVQAYCYRLCATDVPDNRRPWPKPAEYDQGRYELLLRNFEAGDLRRPWNPILMPNRKTDANNNFAFSTDHIGANYDYPEADYAHRALIVADHRSYQQGLMWTLANHPRVPEQVREHYNVWGLARDEFVDDDNWPRQLYVREARRMVGDHVMTQHECQGLRTAPEPIGLAAYTMDSHHVQRHVVDGAARNEGDVQVGGFPPYGIAYGALLPQREQCTNLAVPVCLSATHIAFGSIRMEPVFMVLGQSAATAACLAIDGDMALQDVDYELLRERLLADGQVLAWGPPQTPLTPLTPLTPGTDPTSLAGQVIDDEQAEWKGAWTRSSSQRPFVGVGYHHDGNSLKGQGAATFSCLVERAGRYELRLGYTPHENRAGRVPVTILAGELAQQRFVDQRLAPPIDGRSVSLGTFVLSPGLIEVRVETQGTSGYVVVDYVQVLPAED